MATGGGSVSSGGGRVRTAPVRLAPGRATGAGPMAGGVVRVRGASRIVNRDLNPFTRQMSAMMRAGMSLVASLSTIEELVGNPVFRRVIAAVRETVEGGGTFSDGLARFPSIFDELYVNIVRAGERSGEFAETLRRICLLLEANAKLRRKVKSAMTYPLVVLCLALAIAAALVTFVVPVFKKMFEDFGARLPGPTRALVALSDGIRHNIWIIVPVIFAVIYAVRQWARSDAGKWTLHGFYLRMPIFGGLVQKVAMTRFARILALMVRSGVPILDSLEIVAQACGNRVVGAAILQARTVVEQGEPLARGLSDKPCIPLLVTRMVAAGERSGRVDEMLDHIADAYDEEIEATLAALTSMIEPLLMVLLGVIIGSIVIALFMPIFQLGSIVNA